jgi:hypothetical protein
MVETSGVSKCLKMSMKKMILSRRPEFEARAEWNKMEHFGTLGNVVAGH